MAYAKIRRVRYHYTPHFTVVIVLLLVLIAGVLTSGKPVSKQKLDPQHICIDDTHATCDGKCECDGLGCDLSISNTNTDIDDTHPVYTAAEMTKMMREYQLQVENDAVIIWDKGRYVGVLPYSQSCRFDKIITRDNK